MRKAARLDAPVRQYLRRFYAERTAHRHDLPAFLCRTPTFFALSYFGLYLDYRYPVAARDNCPAFSGDNFLHRAEHCSPVRTSSAFSPATRTAALADGRTFRYGQLIWAADQTALYRALGERCRRQPQAKSPCRAQPRHRFHTDAVSRADFSREAEAACGAHAFYTPVADGLSSLPDWRTLRCDGTEALRRWTGSYLETTTYELSIPALRDPALAPAGKTGWIASTLFDYELAKFFADSGEYESFKSLATKTILRDSARPSDRLDRKIEYSSAQHR
jgi:hypothetical protein